MDRKTERLSSYRLLFAHVYDDALRFALRRADPTEAEDATASAMLTAWRRFDQAPESLDAQRAWVFGIVRKALQNQRRGLLRRRALAVRVAEHTAEFAQDDFLAVEIRTDIAAAWRRLSAGHQEVLALAIFEQLDSTTAAQALGIRASTYRVRLTRARAALRAALEYRPLPPITQFQHAHLEA